MRRDGVPVPLEPLPARILVRLIEHRGSLVPRQDLLALGWSDPAEATDQSLNTVIYEIRRALRYAGQTTVTIETLRGRGYRLRVEPTGRPIRVPWHARMIARGALAAAGLAAVIVLLTLSEPTALPSVPPDAWRMIVEARYLAEDTQDPAAARVLLDSARSDFPDVAAVHAEWADISARLGELDSAAIGAARALSLDPRVATAHRVRGLLAMLRSDWAVADAELGQARALDPRDARTLVFLAFRHTIAGRFRDADPLLREAARIDPLSGPVRHDAGLLHLLAGRYDAAARSCRHALRLKPESRWATDCLFDATNLDGRVEDAAHWGRALLRLYDEPEPSVEMRDHEVVAAVEDWRLREWTRAVEQGAYPLGLALAYAAHDRRDDAMQVLWEAAAHPQLGVLTVAVDPRLAALRPHRDFTRLLDRLKLDAAIQRAPFGG